MNEKQIQDDLMRQLEASQNRMKNCKHVFNAVKYNPDKEMKPYGSVQDGMGSDPHWSPAGYMQVDKPRWSRECKHCGKIEYTYEQENVIIKSELKPKF
jgi:hypothetical protein